MPTPRQGAKFSIASAASSTHSKGLQFGAILRRCVNCAQLLQDCIWQSISCTVHRCYSIELEQGDSLLCGMPAASNSDQGQGSAKQVLSNLEVCQAQSLRHMYFAHLSEGSADGAQLCSSVSCLARRSGLCEHLIGTCQLGLVGLALTVCHGHWQHHFSVGSCKGGDLGAQPAQGVPLQDVV